MDEPTSARKFDFHKVFATIGIILIVMIIIGGGIWYFVQRAADKVPVDDNSLVKVSTASATPKIASVSADTSNWKSYQNKDFGYSIKYPSEWLITSEASSEVCSSDFVFFAPSGDLLGKCGSEFAGIVSISVEKSGNLDGSFVGSDYTDFKSENVTIDNKTAKRISGVWQFHNENTDRRGYKIIDYRVKAGNNIINLSYSQEPAWSDYSKEFEDMVSTFKLL